MARADANLLHAGDDDDEPAAPRKKQKAAEKRVSLALQTPTQASVLDQTSQRFDGLLQCSKVSNTGNESADDDASPQDDNAMVLESPGDAPASQSQGATASSDDEAADDDDWSDLERLVEHTSLSKADILDKCYANRPRCSRQRVADELARVACYSHAKKRWVLKRPRGSPPAKAKAAKAAKAAPAPAAKAGRADARAQPADGGERTPRAGRRTTTWGEQPDDDLELIDDEAAPPKAADSTRSSAAPTSARAPPARTRLPRQVLLPAEALDVSGFAELVGNVHDTLPLLRACEVATAAFRDPGKRDGWELLHAATALADPNAVPTNKANRTVRFMAESVLILLRFVDELRAP